MYIAYMLYMYLYTRVHVCMQFEKKTRKLTYGKDDRAMSLYPEKFMESLAMTTATFLFQCML